VAGFQNPLNDNQNATSPGISFTAVTPSDSTVISCRALWVGTTGNLAVLGVGDTVAVTIMNVPVGLFPFAVQKVMNTNTTASNIVAIS